MDFNFKVNENEANILITGLGELQAKVSHELIENIRSQARQQIEENKKEDLS